MNQERRAWIEGFWTGVVCTIIAACIATVVVGWPVVSSAAGHRHRKASPTPTDTNAASPTATPTVVPLIHNPANAPD